MFLSAINICMSRLSIKLFQSIKIRPQIISLPRMWYELFMMSRVHKNNFHDVLSHCQITVGGPFDPQHQWVWGVTHCQLWIYRINKKWVSHVCLFVLFKSLLNTLMIYEDLVSKKFILMIYNCHLIFKF